MAKKKTEEPATPRRTCTSETCDAIMRVDGNILRCVMCDNTTTIKGWERAQQPVSVELTEKPELAVA